MFPSPRLTNFTGWEGRCSVDSDKDGQAREELRQILKELGYCVKSVEEKAEGMVITTSVSQDAKTRRMIN